MKVREALRRIEQDGWILVAPRGSHRQFKHPRKPGRVTVAGKPSDDLAPGTLKSPPASRPGAGALMRYVVVIEPTDTGFSAYVPDLPGCVATGPDLPSVELAIREAIEFHLDGLREDGLPIPAPTSLCTVVEV